MRLKFDCSAGGYGGCWWKRLRARLWHWFDANAPVGAAWLMKRNWKRVQFCGHIYIYPLGSESFCDETGVITIHWIIITLDATNQQGGGVTESTLSHTSPRRSNRIAVQNIKKVAKNLRG
jgi:hypothetical protein